MDAKYIFIFIVVLIWGFVYAYIEENRESISTKTLEETTNRLSDSVKVVTEGNLNIYFFNVGQADSILLENAGKYMLIDAGNNADGENIVNYLEELGVRKIDYLIATHAHEDHIGGMDNIIEEFEIGRFFMPDVVTTTKTFEDLIIALENKKIKFETPKIGDIFLFEGCKFEVLHLSNDDSDLNDTSIVLRGLYGDNSFLFMGDATSNVEENILKSNIDSDLLKVGHHGSKYSSSKAFLEVVTPKYAIISVGKDNSYQHPHSITFTKLEAVDASIYRTDLDNTILVSSDGSNISIKKLDVNLDG